MSAATKNCQKTRLEMPSRDVDRRACEVPGAHRRGAPQQDADDQGQPVRFDEADSGMRRARDNATDRAAREEDPQYIRPHAPPRRGDQEIKRVSAENQLSNRRRHDDLQLLAPERLMAATRTRGSDHITGTRKRSKYHGDLL
jgi:hypothetical protein